MDEDEDLDAQDSNAARERAAMMREHAAALARERYEGMHDGNGMKNLVNPSIPKMEVLNACFLNCIKENVFQKYKMTIYLNV